MSALDKRFVFVIGAPRSGTSWLHQMLAQHPAVAAMAGEELTIFSRYVHMWVHNYEEEAKNITTGKWRQGLPCVWDAGTFEANMLRFVEDVYGRVLARNAQATHILDKHPNYSNHLPMIDRFLPQSRFIHIIRDGREVAVSMMSVRKRVGHSPGEVRGAAREWHRCISNARAYGAKLGPERYTEVRYEDLRANTLDEFSRLCSFASLPAEGQVINRIVDEFHISKKQVSNGDTAMNALREKPGAIWREGMSLTERYIFDRMVGDLLHSLGYADHDWWALSATDRLRILPYRALVKVKRSMESLSSIWSSEAEERLP